LKDFAAFQACFGHSSVGACSLCNLAGGAMIDLDDFDMLAAVFGGPS
jgi:hypothetical protein